MKNNNVTKPKMDTNVISKAIICLVCAVFILVISLRKYIFMPDTLIYNLYEEDAAGRLLAKILKTCNAVAIGFILVQGANLVVFISKKVKDNTVKTFTLLTGSILKYVCFIVVLFTILMVFGVDTTTLVTGAGVLSLVIGLGCQSLISDIVSGIFMLLEGDIKVGDVVVINGWRGTVLQIGLRRTRIEDTVGNVNIINNSSISNIINNTRELSVANCEVGIEYNESIRRVETILSENFDRIREEIPAIVEGPFYQGVSQLGESSVVIKVTAKVKEEDIYQAQRDLNRSIKIIFDENNVNIPFNQVVVNYRDENEKKSLDRVTTSEIKEAQQFFETQKDLSKGVETINQ